jgi:pimeloyl-ACP methyl ester carboxylesterase
MRIVAMRGRLWPARRAARNPSATRVAYLTTTHGDAALSYQVQGSGPPLLLIHGLAGSGRWWAKNVDALAAHFQIYVIDLIGFGGSRVRSYGDRFILNEAADVLLAFMDRLGIDRASLMGHSMGGHIAAALTARTPERVERLVLVDAAALPIRRGAARHLLALSVSLPRFPARFLPVLLVDSWRAGLRTIWRAGRELLVSDIQAEVAQIRVPTLVVWGARDRIVPTSLGRQLAASVPGAELLVVEGAGHNPMWERPDVFNRAVLRFLNGA